MNDHKNLQVLRPKGRILIRKHSSQSEMRQENEGSNQELKPLENRQTSTKMKHHRFPLMRKFRNFKIYNLHKTKNPEFMGCEDRKSVV